MLQAYGLNCVRMEDAYCVNAFRKDVAYLLKFDTDRLLAGFYETAGLAMKKMRYPGWEGMLIGGHTLGHYLTAAAQAVASAQIDSQEKTALFEKIKALIDGLLECQKHSKGKPGFVFGAIMMDPDNVELQFDYVEQNKSNIITQAWVPWYTMHKILDGIVAVYELTGYEPALTLGSGIGDWTYNRAKGWSEETHRTVLGIEYGGMNDALYELYKCTGKEEHLWAAHMFDEEPLYQAVASGRENVLTNYHANTTIPKFVGALNRYLTLGESAAEYLEYVKAFWDMVVERHTYITGGNSEWEHFGEDYALDAERTNCNNETCNTYNMLKMTAKLFQITGDRKYADYYENTLINAILSSQNPQTGMTMYFQPMATGYFKVYGTEFDKFWCCTGSGMENFTKLNNSVYFAEDRGILVNLFLSSTLQDERLGITLRQETNLPKDPVTTFTVSCKEDTFAVLKVRIPDWADSITAEINEKQAEGKRTGGYLCFERTWQDGDVLTVKFGIRVKAYGLPDSKNVYAFRYGPLLLSADLGTENMVDGKTGVDVTIPTNKIVEKEYLTLDQGTMEDFIENIDRHMVRKGEGLEFVLTGTDCELTFTPHYLKTRERYGIYWYFLDENSDREELLDRKKKEEFRREHILDTVQPGYGQYENDELHDMMDEGSVGNTSGSTFRYAKARGGFGYHMRVSREKEHILEIHLFKEDNGKLLRVFVGDEEIFNKKIHYTGREQEYTIELPIRKEWLEKYTEQRPQGETIPVFFRGGMFEDSARLAEFLYMLAY